MSSASYLVARMLPPKYATLRYLLPASSCLVAALILKNFALQDNSAAPRSTAEPPQLQYIGSLPPTIKSLIGYFNEPGVRERFQSHNQQPPSGIIFENLSGGII